DDGIDTSATYNYFMIMDGASLTLRHLDISGISSGAALGRSMLYFDVSPSPTQSKIGAIRAEHCVFHDFVDNIFHGMKDTLARGLEQDSLFIDDVVVHHCDGFLQYKHVSLHYLEMRRTTAYALRSMALKIGKIGYRSTNVSPAGIIDRCTFDAMGGEHGHIQVDDAFSPLVVSNSILSNIHDSTIQPPIYFKTPHLEAAVTVKYVCFWRDGRITASPTAPYWPGYVFADTLTRDPGYRDPARGDFTLPGDSPLLTFGSDGG